MSQLPGQPQLPYEPITWFLGNGMELAAKPSLHFSRSINPFMFEGELTVQSARLRDVMGMVGVSSLIIRATDYIDNSQHTVKGLVDRKILPKLRGELNRHDVSVATTTTSAENNRTTTLHINPDAIRHHSEAYVKANSVQSSEETVQKIYAKKLGSVVAHQLIAEWKPLTHYESTLGKYSAAVGVGTTAGVSLEQLNGNPIGALLPFAAVLLLYMYYQDDKTIRSAPKGSPAWKKDQLTRIGDTSLFNFTPLLIGKKMT